MSTCVSLSIENNVAVMEIDNAPVNALSKQVVAGLAEKMAEFEANADLDGLVICASGKAFVAGGDIEEFDSPEFSPKPFNDFLDRLEACERPVVAAINGLALGGGLELAMSTHYRVAAEGVVVGLPEINLGIIPGSHGTQLLPRLVGLSMAADMMSTGKNVKADEALSSGLLDKVVPAAELRSAAIESVKSLVGTAARRTKDLALPDSDSTGLDNVVALAAKQPMQPAYEGLIKALEAARDLPFAEGTKVESEWFDKLVNSSASRSLRYLFFAERFAKNIPVKTPKSALRSVEKVGVLGIGTMGAGIAVASLLAGYSVYISEVNQGALDKGTERITDALSAMVKRGKLAEEKSKAILENLTGGIGVEVLGDCDLIIEAIFEDMKLKCETAEKLGKACKSGAILATNTSTLDVNEIARASGRPDDVIGMHFFSPAHIMRLLEVVRGDATAPEVISTVLDFAGRIKKVVAVSGVCYGFIGNRMAEVYMRENELMQLEGATPSDIDGAAQNPAIWGMAMGPNRMLDMAGVDVGARTVIEWIKSGVGPKDPGYRILCREMFEAGSHGQKVGHGYYRYEGRNALPNPETEALAAKLAQEQGVERRTDIPESEIFERLLFPMVNEAARILDEGIAYRGSDIDIVWAHGYGFPKWRGGPLFMADEIGLGYVVERMDYYAERSGNKWGYWDVSPLLRKLAAEGGRLSAWQSQ